MTIWIRGGKVVDSARGVMQKRTCLRSSDLLSETTSSSPAGIIYMMSPYLWPNSCLLNLSLVISYLSLVICHWSFDIRHLYVRLFFSGLQFLS